MLNKEVLIFLLLLLFLTVNSFAAERYEFYNGARQMGMGGAAVAVVNDETALILNPAALGKLRDKYLTLVDPEIHMGANTAQILKAQNYDLTKAMDPQDLLNLLLANPDKHFHSKAQMFPSLVFPNFGVGLLASYNYDAENVTSTSMYHLRYRNDYAALIGYNFRFFDGIIKLGFNGKYINRVETDQSMANTSTNLKWGNLVNEGVGIGSDVGLILTAPWEYLPTLAVVARDVGDTSYNVSSGMFYNNRPKPVKTKQSIDTGISFSPILGKYTRMQITADYRDVMTDDTTENTTRRLHYGLEFNFFDKLFLRGGMNQGYWTAGFEVASETLQFQVATYGEEIGTTAATREDRRYVFKFALRF
jgi:hypothetical protein